MKREVLQIALAKGVGDKTLKKCLNKAKEKGYDLDDIISEKALKDLGFNDDKVESILSKGEEAESIVSRMEDDGIGIEMLVETEKGYPEFLKKTMGDNCPPLLFLRGNKDILKMKSAAFAGTRDVSEKGMKLTELCVEQLVEKDIAIVSGNANGTDMAAHRAALMNGGKTVFVLPEGIFNLKPNKEINEMITLGNSLFISQFLPNYTWHAGRAMQRNALVIGLSEALIIAESKKSGGTFAAGEEAMKAGCPLFVIDYKNPDKSAEGNPYFIEKGAFPVRGNGKVPNLSGLFKVIEEGRVSSEEKEQENKAQQLKLDM